MPGVSRFPRASAVRAAIPGIVALVTLPLVAVRAVSDPSPWLHLKVGEYLAEGNRFTQPDPWAPLAVGEYIPTQWLPSVITAILYDRWGLTAVAWTRAAGIIALFALLLLFLSRVCRPWIATALAGGAVVASWPWLTERPQLLGFVLLVPVVAAWWQTAHDQRARWWLVPLTWVAASCHGVWALGLVIGGLVVVGLLLGRDITVRAFATLAGLLGACLAVAALTPLGPRLLLTPFTVGANGKQFVLEWMPSSVRMPAVAFALAMLGAAWAIWMASRRRPPAYQQLLFACAVSFTLTMQRTVPVGALLAVLLLGDALDHWSQQRAPMLTRTAQPARTVAVSWLSAAVLASLIAVPVASSRAQQATGVPTGLGSPLVSLPQGTRVVAFGDLTGWLMFTAPQLKPVFDLRIEQYPPTHVRRYIRAMHAQRGWEEFVRATGAEVAVLEADSPLTAALTEQLDWRLVAQDGQFVLLESQRDNAG